jgi:hypothetical protein
MPRSEHIGVDPVWQRVVLPSTACLRLGILLALGLAPNFHVEVAVPVLVVAAGLGLVYVAAYAAVWAGRLSSEYLGYGAILDTFLLGALLGGSGAHAPLVGFLCLLGLSLAHMCGGVRLSLAAIASLAVGWVGVEALGVDLVSSPAWTGADFSLALDAEPTYGGRALSALSEHQIVRAALASLFLISLSGCLAFARAQWERRRVARACAEVEALEAIVDCFTGNASEAELWETVGRSAAQVSGARVFCAVADDEMVRVEGARQAADGDDVLHGLRVPLSASDNLIVQGILSGREAETENLADLLEGSESATGGPPPRRRAHYVVIPIPRHQGGAALIAVVHGNAAAAAESLRLVAERTELVLRARESFRSRFELEPAPAGA